MESFGFIDFNLRDGKQREALPAGIETFHQAVSWVWKLPYGRNSIRSDYMLVPKERRGACSTKHAFLAQLASEQQVELKLILGIFMMDALNTPKICALLSVSVLTAIPEAHCCLRYEGSQYDFTYFDEQNSFWHPTIDFLYEEEIDPDQIGEYKIKKHQV
jgi:hypothetical protein